MANEDGARFYKIKELASLRSLCLPEYIFICESKRALRVMTEVSKFWQFFIIWQSKFPISYVFNNRDVFGIILELILLSVKTDQQHKKKKTTQKWVTHWFRHLIQIFFFFNSPNSTGTLISLLQKQYVSSGQANAKPRCDKQFWAILSLYRVQNLSHVRSVIHEAKWRPNVPTFKQNIAGNGRNVLKNYSPGVSHNERGLATPFWASVYSKDSAVFMVTHMWR